MHITILIFTTLYVCYTIVTVLVPVQPHNEHKQDDDKSQEGKFPFQGIFQLSIVMRYMVCKY